MAHWWMISLACTVLLQARLQAQDLTLDALAMGVRLRVTADCVMATSRAGRSPSPTRRDRAERCESYEGRLTRRTADSLTLDLDGREQALARSSVRAIEARMGRQGSASIGLVIGGAVGLAAGIASAVATDCRPDDPFRDLCETSQVAGPLMGALLGGGAGWLIGSLVKRDRWVPVLRP